MVQFSRFVLGYHGCELDFAERLIRGDKAIADWKPSQNAYDWLGHGIYFWEFAPQRALEWGGKGAVDGAIIQLGNCLDFTEIEFTDLLSNEYHKVLKLNSELGIPLPENRGKRRDLDCFVINSLIQSTGTIHRPSFETVRCAFLEGDVVYPGSGILRDSHVQIAVRDQKNILGVFRPNI